MENKDNDILLAEHEVKIKSLEKRMNKVEDTTEQINRLTVSVEKMTTIQSQMLEEQKAQRAELETIKAQPAKDAHDLKQKIMLSVITTITGLIIGAVFALILK